MTASPIGREIDRVDGRPKVTGAAEYAADHDLPGLAHAVVVTSTIGRGEILAMDLAAALAAPGVLEIYHPGNNLGLLTPPQNMPPPGMVENYAPLQDTAIRYRGQAIAVVVAETFEQARDAAALVTTTYRTDPPNTSLAANLPGEDAPGPLYNVSVLAPGVGSIDEALAASEVVVESTFHQPIQHHVAMEPHAAVAEWNAAGDRVTIHTGSQGTFATVQLLQLRLGLPAEAIHVICTYTGGGFGSRVPSWNDSILAAGVARRLGRPVKLVMTREQVFTMVGHRGQVDHTVRLGATRTGVLTAVSHDADAELPNVGGWLLVPAHDTTDTLYKTPNLHIGQRLVQLDLPPTWAMRGPNEAPGAFALETAMDELAVATGVDPVELRLRNYATVAPGNGKPFSSKHLADCYREGARRFGWSARRATPRSRTDGQWLIGMGMATAIYPGNRMPVSVSVELCADETAIVSTATSDIGNGAATVVAITGADRLGIPVRKVTARVGDSTLPPGAVAAGSQATASTVPSVLVAADDVVTALIDLAVTDPRSPWHDGARPVYANGRLHGGGHSATFGQLLTAVGRKSIEARATTQLAPETAERFEFHSFGAHFCEVRVNRFTGEPRVTRFTTVVDSGRIINAQAARSQLIGGVIFGIGQALLEHDPLELGTGRLAAANMADYMVPVNADVPDIDVHWLDRPDPHVDGLGARGLGARGLGELGAVGSAAAIGNAVYNATGIRVRETPITLDKLLEV
ncbi:xanthine dehydrogenase YagR molybdenum-binding subunit [Catenuloplanes nepalensis]|uniref:Xanthine dehydrogenase YagR molybdenum-binding subunit n=1 Tax=Catenuloplanes nepalensis TaxID=587533 RepID=A0ABT9MXG1_9ACTN|nr:xanthine dehydrogenase family protein molybdopterin-binding subunit [Catenuloplanes nepalensis]MDP9796117.1 xanthine dehydrogenase YagR molybdenum-binding subunit [Catenuloplanes nepalensis]